MTNGRPLRSVRRLSNRAWERPAWYKITNSADGVPAQVAIYDEIGFYGVTAGEFMADIDAITGDLEMHINSPGGDIYDGITIYNRLKQRKGSIHVIVDGLAASAASFIAMAASPGMLEMAPRSEMMIHNGFTMAIGDAADLRKTADLLEKKTADIAGMYAERSGKPAAYWLAKMAEETWFSAAEAVSEGLADRIQGQDGAGPQAQWDLSVFARYAGAPAAKGKKKAKQPKGEPEQLGDGWVQDPDGRVRFDPDGDGDDDSTAEGDTDHDYFDADGKQIKDIPPRPGGSSDGKTAGNRATFPALNADVDDSAWDGQAAMSAAVKADDPAAAFKAICAGRRAGDPDLRKSWALPHHKHPGAAPNAAGVRDALGRLPQTQELTNAGEARSHLEAHMKEINPDYEPDDLIDPGMLAAALTAHLDGGN